MTYIRKWQLHFHLHIQLIVALWMQPSEPLNQSDAVTRYAIFKKMYDEGKLCSY